ncbi:thioesterase family protein [Pelagicoccus sp. SDUM812002]|uniref:acyl-CoA thioesterase n=1 Tax=Pelagicoccus sp. SDUM812002 TaxID=3041266 RepID=UPI00280DD8E0|nr:thioesterase family protein [Pelagicoccus sp. SDUM812002]MDQ8185246.1 thioesterase family protein [Pelagicoccus sp. SDUM812002]
MFQEIKTLDRVDFTTCIPFRITDHNYGDHVANNVFVEYLHEGRVQFLANWGYTEKNVEGVGLTLSELCVKYTRQAFYPDTLRLDITITNPRPTRFDLCYRGYNKRDEQLLLAKTEMAAIDKTTGRPTRLPEVFFKSFGRELA